MYEGRKVSYLVTFLASSAIVLSNRNVYCDSGASGARFWTSAEDSWSYWWSYSGVSGPSYWGLLNLDWSICDKGRRQSPIDIETKTLMFDQHLGPLRTDSDLTSGLLYNDGHALVFNASAYLTLDSAQIAARQQNSTTGRRRRSSLEAELKDEISSKSIFDSQTNLMSSVESAEQKLDSGSVLKELEESVKLTINQQQQELAEGGSDLGDEQATGASDQSQSSDQESSLSQRVHFTIAGFAYPFRFEAFSLRFSLDDKLGSEHAVNGHHYAGELQLLAYNSMLYKSYAEASTKPHGLLAIAVLVDILPVSKTTTHVATNGQLDNLLNRIADLKYRGSSIPVTNLNLSSLLPETDNFITYEGSLTTPGCHESVNWLVLNKPLYITRTNLDNLRSISADEQTNTPTGTLIAGNTRPLQPINGRPVRTNIKPQTRGGGQNPETCQRLWTRYDYRPTRSIQSFSK